MTGQFRILGTTSSQMARRALKPFAGKKAEVQTPKPVEPTVQIETFQSSTPTEEIKESSSSQILTAAKRAGTTGVGLTLAGVPIPISAGVAALQFGYEAAPETTSKILKSTTAKSLAVAGGVVLVAESLNGPIATFGKEFVNSAMGHDYLPGFG